MRRRDKSLLAAVVALVACAAAGPQASLAAVVEQRPVSEPTEAVPGEIVVGYQPEASAGERAGARRDARVDAVRALGLATQLVEVREGSTAAALAALRTEEDVRYASRNWLRRPFAVPNDPLFGHLWGLHNLGQPIGQQKPVSGTPDADVDAPEAWDIETGWLPDPEGAEPIVAVMDTGVDLGHRDLATQLWTNPGEVPGNGLDDDGNGYADDLHGYDFAGESVNDPLDRDADPDDPAGHGTHVSGTILAEGNDGEGIVGVAPGSRLMALKVCALDEEGEASCPLAAMIEAYAYAAANGARILNGSLGGSGFAAAEVALLNANPEVLFVFAAGNEKANDDQQPSYPCALDEQPGYVAENLLCVAATDLDDGLAGFSNFGAESVDLAAPGVKTLSAYPEALVDTDEFLPYLFMSGTSMASPHVAGAAALLTSAVPSATAAQTKAAIMTSVDARPALAGKTVSGGRLNLDRALQAIGLAPAPEEEGEPGGEAGGGEADESVPAPPPASQLAPSPEAPAQPRASIGPQAAPHAFFRKRPGKVIRTRRRRATAFFRFGSDRANVAFVCAIDGGRGRTCPESLRRSFAIGRHVVMVRARDAAGNAGPFAIHRFRVKLIR
jgi:subtilisin family serine protease